MCQACWTAEEREAQKQQAAKENAPSRTLTRETLLRGHPCGEYRNRFTERFPEQAEVTVELAVSQADDWDWYWAAETLLSYAGMRQFQQMRDKAMEQYYATLKPYQEIADKAGALYWDTLDRVTEEGRRDGVGYYERDRRAREAASAAADREVQSVAMTAVRKLAQSRLDKALAKEWAEIYISETDEQLFADRRGLTYDQDYDDDYEEDEDY